jgi:anti-anti-sigma factor
LEDAVPRRDSHETGRSAHTDGTLEIDHRLRLSGELTQATVGTFEKAIRVALQASPREVVVDLTGIDLIDDAGLTALLKAHLRSRRHRLPITFVPAEHEAVKQVVAITGTDEISD